MSNAFERHRPPPPTADIPTAPPSILIVDDVPANLHLLAGMLRERGYEPRPVPSGKLALQAAKADPPDLILLDIHMPEMNGYEVCERLKADQVLQDIPVLFISALRETTDKVKAFSVGAVDYVTKPFHLEEVHARVATQLELARKKRELRQSYGRLCELECLRDNLVHMIVHDMRSPLTVILGNLEMAEDEPLSEDAAHFIAQAGASTRLLLEMVSTLLDVSKMEAGRMTLELSATDMRVLVSETIRMVEPLRGRRSITTLAPAGEMEANVCDGQLIRRVMENLIVNAIKFTHQNEGVITISIERGDEGKIRVSVADNGPGIPLEFHEKVFDKFSQAAVWQGGRKYSTGLGLTFCKLAVEAHDGRIGLESEEGKGSTFWFELPRR